MWKEIKNLYDSFADEESKIIFRHRLMYSLTGEWKHIADMLLYYQKDGKGYLNILDVMKNPRLAEGREVILFGTGNWGTIIARILQRYGIEIDCCCDNNVEKQGKQFSGKRILSPEELAADHASALVFIATERWEQKVLEQLHQMGFGDLQIVRINYTQNRVYFDETIVHPRGKEIFVDAGCYDGETDFDFVSWAGACAKKVYAFEPDTANMEKCRRNLSSLGIACQLEHAGLWSGKAVLDFADGNETGSGIRENGRTKIQAVDLDSIVGEDNVTFVKMDIEGAELEALKGAAGTIRRCRPRLAVCLYHKPEDILEIPVYLKSLVPEYKLYIRHYYPSMTDTVLYAV